MNLKICKLNANATVPTYAHGTDACFDLYAATVDGMTKMGAMLSHGSPVVCGTGLAFEVPEGYALMIYSRSGHGFKTNTRLANCVGVIDCGYTGEVMVKLTMDDQFLENELDLYIKPGDRIAQAMLVQVPRITFEVVEQLSLTERGDGGFGITGQGGAA